MNVLDLFSGIGGFSLGLERAGMRTVAFCEIEPFCRAVLTKHWPSVPVFVDIRLLSGELLKLWGIEQVDVICGGFPCQDISHAAGAKARGLEGDRSGLWFEMRRLVRELRPAWVLVENVPRLRTLGADTVLADLAESSYTARPLVVGAIHAGADHIRRRVWIVANANRIPVRHESGRSGGARWESSALASFARSDANRQSEHHLPLDAEVEGRAGIYGSAADTGSEKLAIGKGERRDDGSQQQTAERSAPSLRAWEAGPFDGDPVADGLPENMDAAIKAYGNAVLPQLTELLGRAIMKTRAQPGIEQHDPGYSLGSRS